MKQKDIWFNYEIYLWPGSIAYVSQLLVPPADAVKEDVNELLSQVGWCL